MNTPFILNAWPDDERDRKRAPARCWGCLSRTVRAG